MSPELASTLVRLNVVETFRSYLGRYDDEFLEMVWSGVGVDRWNKKMHHCGATALFVLKQCGLFLDKQWLVGSGFALVRPYVRSIHTKFAQPGDLVVYRKGWHHAIITDNDLLNHDLRIIQGNGEGRRVTETYRARNEVEYCFTIQDEIERITK